jgi:cell pole-organizing protein PopZ
MAGAREPSMEDILASIKRVIAEEKEIRASAPPPSPGDAEEEDVLELDATMEAAPIVPADLGPPLLEEEVADESRQKLEALANVAASAPPPPQFNPLEEMIREMLRPILKHWLDEHLPGIVDEHVKREIHRITGRPV